MNELLKTYKSGQKINRGLKIYWIIFGIFFTVVGVIQHEWLYTLIVLLLSVLQYISANQSLKSYTCLYDETKAVDEKLAREKKEFMESLLTKG